ncbi:hypothetical protein Q0F99_05110 [Rathayibacter oskolensis]|nr:hypothetical protein [Rathayibacter oskolensis]WKK72356.1 hypothetical protein Q0F99_05110 [Rathayibacter oskolensis]
MAGLDLVVQLDEGDAVVEAVLLEERDESRVCLREPLSTLFRIDGHQRVEPRAILREGGGLLVLPGRNDHEHVVLLGGLEQREEVLFGVDDGGRLDVVPAHPLGIAAAERPELQRARVDVRAEEEERHRADADRVVPALDRACEGGVEVLERFARAGAHVPGEVPEGDRQLVRDLRCERDGLGAGVVLVDEHGASVRSRVGAGPWPIWRSCWRKRRGGARIWI